MSDESVRSSSALKGALLNGIESTVGAAPVMRLFGSAPPVDCAAADPADLLCSITLPSDWMASATGNEKFQSGTPWVGICTTAGTIASFRIIAGGACVIQGTVTERGAGGDLTLQETTVEVGVRIRIQRFRLLIPEDDATTPLPTITGTLSKTQSADTVAIRGQAQVPPVIEPAAGDRVQWIDTEVGDMPTYEFASASLFIPWKRGTESAIPIQQQGKNGLPQRVGGDWIDRNGTGNGAVPFATIAGGSPNFNSTPKWLSVSGAGVIALVNKWITDGNTGVLVHEIGSPGIPAYFHSRQNPSGNAPKLTVTATTSGTTVCSCIADTWWDAATYATRGDDPNLRPRFICKFDLSSIAGTVTAATLEFYYQIYGGAPLAIDFLDMPKLIYAPAEQLPNLVEYGIAREVANDQALATHPDVLVYREIKNDLEMSAATGGGFQWGGNYQLFTYSHPDWPEYGLRATSVTNTMTTNTATNRRTMWVNRPTGIANRLTNIQTTFQNAYEHLFVRYLLRLENDVAARLDPPVNVPGYGLKSWSNWDGTKLPGIQGLPANYPDYPTGSWVADGWAGTDAASTDGPYYMMEHDSPSLCNDRAMALTCYLYDEDTPARLVFAGGGRTEYPGVCIKPNRTYCIEQELQLNTITDGTPNRDGVHRVWLDGVKVYERTDRLYRRMDMQRWFTGDLLIMHGGNGPPAASQTYSIAGWTIARSYVGPPQSGPAWRRNLPVNQFSPIVGTQNLGGLSTHVFAFATVDDNQAFAVGKFRGRTKVTYAANGGHNNSWENKVIQLDLHDDTPAWRLLHPGSAESAVVVDQPYYRDGLPASRHTYYTAHHIEQLDRVMLFTISGLWGNSGNRGEVDAFKLTDNTWEVSGTYPNNFSPYPDSPVVASTGLTSVCKHPTTEEVYISADYKFIKWSPVTNTYTNVLPGLTPSLGAWQGQGACIDTVRNRWVSLQAPSPGYMPSLSYINLSTSTYGTIALTLNGSPFGPIQAYAQITHDLDNDRYIVIYHWHTAATPCPVYAIDPTSGIVTQITTVTPNPYNGTNGRLQYVPELGGVVFHARYTANVMFMPTR